ncbi:hypothetical protein WBP07_05615 [Novosphingobium sp. BL-8A]|uniref:hypothetical protein n=1 Tax=Novosphingobium sp. BL-8A TaxID=3127639 RepID=UPI0037572DC2
MSDAETKKPAQSATDANLGAVVPIRPASETDSPSRKVIAFVKKHPVLVVAGGLAAGAVVSALLPRRVTRNAMSRTMEFAEAAGGAAMLLGRNASNKAHDLGIGAKREAGHIADRAEKAGGLAAERLERYGLAALAAAGALGRATADKAEKVSSVAATKAGKLGHDAAETASEKTHRFAQRMQDFAQRISH